MSTSQLHLRRASVEDAAEIARLMSDEDVMAQTLQLPYANAVQWAKRLEDPGIGSIDLHLIAERDGQVLGSAGLHSTGKAVRRSLAVSFGISVAKKFQGQGVGSALIQALLDYADRWTPIMRIELTVWADNQRAIALYLRHGFAVEGTLRAYGIRDGKLADAVAMARIRCDRF